MDGKKGKRLACRLLGGSKGLAEWSDLARVRSGLPTWLEMPWGPHHWVMQSAQSPRDIRRVTDNTLVPSLL